MKITTRAVCFYVVAGRAKQDTLARILAPFEKYQQLR